MQTRFLQKIKWYKPFLVFCVLVIQTLFINQVFAQQVQVVLKHPPYNQLKIEHLWNLTLTNTTQDILPVYLYGTLTESEAGLIATGTSTTIQLPPGVKTFTAANYQELDPQIDYTSSDPKYQESVMRTGGLPDGDYEICVHVRLVSNNNNIGDDCIQQIIELMQPPSLISPDDGDTLMNKRPVFTWMHDVTPGIDVNYKIKIVEIYPPQSVEIAMQNNPAWYEEDKIKNTVFTYPTSARKLEQGKTYAWGIEAAGVWSEIWSFLLLPGGQNINLVFTPLQCQGCCFEMSITGNFDYFNAFKLTSTSNPISSVNLLTGLSTVSQTTGEVIVRQSPGAFVSGSNIGSICFTQSSSPFPVSITWSTNGGEAFMGPPDQTTLQCPPPCTCCDDFIRQVDPFSYDADGLLTTNITAGPNPITKVTAELVYFSIAGNPDCETCVKKSEQWGNFCAADNLTGFDAPVFTTLPGLGQCSREVTWLSTSANGSDLSGGEELNMQLGLPPASTLECCPDTIELCIRFSFTDSLCVTCDTLICITIERTSDAVTIVSNTLHDLYENNLGVRNVLLANNSSTFLPPMYASTKSERIYSTTGLPVSRLISFEDLGGKIFGASDVSGGVIIPQDSKFQPIDSQELETSEAEVLTTQQTQELAVVEHTHVMSQESIRESQGGPFVDPVDAPSPLQTFNIRSTPPELQQNCLEIRKNITQSPISSGVTFPYDIYFAARCAADGVKIIDFIPAPLVVDEVITLTTACGNVPTYEIDDSDPNGTWVTYNIGDLDGGCSGNFNINVHFPAGVTCNGQEVINSAEITALNIDPVQSTPVTVTAEAVSPWEISKTPQTGQNENDEYIAVVGGTLTYEIFISKTDVFHDDTTGQLNLSTVAITDDVPAGATVIGIDCNGPKTWTTNTLDNTVTWYVDDLDAATPVVKVYCYITIQYPPDPPFLGGYILPNTPILSGTLPCGTEWDVEGETTYVLFTDPQPGAELTKTILRNFYNPVAGCKGAYYVLFENTGNVKLENCTITEYLPPELSIDMVHIPNVSSTPVTIEYTWDNTLPPHSTTLYNGGKVTIDNPVTSPMTISGITLAPGKSFPVRIYFTIDDNVSTGTEITNCATLTSTDLTEPIEDCYPFTTEEKIPRVCLHKEVCDDPQTYQPGDILRYRLRIQNVGSLVLTGSTINDVLDQNLTYVDNGTEIYYSSTNYDVSCSENGGYPLNTTEWTGVTSNNTSGNNNLSWDLPDIESDCLGVYYGNCSWEFGMRDLEYYFIEFDVRVNETCPPGVVLNKFTVEEDNLPLPQVWSPEVEIVVNAVPELQIEKLVSVDDGTNWSTSANTTAGSTIMYRLQLENTGNVPLNNIVFNDLLPFVGDHKILMPATLRDSQFDITYVGPPTITLGSLLQPPIVSVTNTPITHEVKFDFSNWELDAGEVLICDFEASVPGNAQVGKIACNSFAITASRTDSGLEMIPTESDNDNVCITIISSPDTCDCIESSWGENTYQNITQPNSPTLLLNPGTQDTLDCNQTYTIKSTYNCQPPDCNVPVSYTLVEPSGVLTDGNVPFSFTPEESGTYTLTLFGRCGTELCDSIVIEFFVECISPDGECCDEFDINMTQDKMTDLGDGVYQIIPELIAGPNKITKISATLEYVNVSYSNPECEVCAVNSDQFGNLSVDPEEEFTEGGTTLTPVLTGPPNIIWSREVIWQDWGEDGSVDLTGGFSPEIQLKFPPQSPISCCVDTIRFCIRYEFTDENCVTCDTLICYDIPPEIASCDSLCENNIIDNWSFIDGNFVDGDGSLDDNSEVDRWDDAYTSPQLRLEGGCCDDGWISMWGNQRVGEAIEQELAAPIVKGNTYRVTLCVRNGTDTNKKDYAQFEVRASMGPLNGPGCTTQSCAVVGKTDHITSAEWITVPLDPWTADADYNYITISVTNESSANHGDSTSFGHIDKVCIREIIEVVDTCACGEWTDSLQVDYTIVIVDPHTGTTTTIATGSADCGDTVEDIALGTTISINSFTGDFICTGTDSCEAEYNWQIFDPSSVLIEDGIGKIINVTFTPLVTGAYTLIITPTCGSEECLPCEITFNVVDDCACSEWDSTKVTFDATTIKVWDGGTATGVTAPQTVTITPNLNCVPEDCPPEYEWRYTDPTSVSVTGTSIPIQITPTKAGTYTVTVNGTCGTMWCDSVRIIVRVKKKGNLPWIEMLNPSFDSPTSDLRPTFRWEVDEPSDEVLYYLRVVVLDSAQDGNPANALVQNLPLIEESGLTRTSFEFPLTKPPLERWEIYVWDVIPYEKSKSPDVTTSPEIYGVFMGGSDNRPQGSGNGNCAEVCATCSGRCVGPNSAGDCFCYEEIPHEEK